DAQAVALLAAVAAALADQLVDEHALVGLGQGAALAPAALLGGAGLVVDDDRGALDLAEFALHRIQLVAVADRDALGQALHAVVLLWLVGHDGDLHRSLGAHALRDLHHAVAFGTLAHLLATGHGHGVVVEDLVGDVDAGGNALADRQDAAVEIGAVTDVGEHVLVGAEGLLAHPGHAFAAHLREADRAAVHPDGHEVAADAGHGARALGHAGAGVVRAAAAEPGLAAGLGRRVQHQRPGGPL